MGRMVKRGSRVLQVKEAADDGSVCHYALDYKRRRRLVRVEQCNGIIEDGDLKCFSCGKQRSELNRKLYEECQPKGLLNQEYHEALPPPEYDDW